jgi:cytidylate kinase
MSIPVITIDGPSGAGKGTVSRLLAKKLGWHYLDSGSIYRSLAIAVLNKALDVTDVDSIVTEAMAMRLVFECADELRVSLADQDITQQLVLEQVGNTASKIAVLPEVRQVLLQKQQDFRVLPGLVADGRDMGTVVFPDAQYKVYLTASALKRAERRYKQLKEKGIDANLSRLTKDIEERDRRDSERAAAPLSIPVDALFIDSSDITIHAVLDQILSILSLETV